MRLPAFIELLLDVCGRVAVDEDQTPTSSTTEVAAIVSRAHGGATSLRDGVRDGGGTLPSGSGVTVLERRLCEAIAKLESYVSVM